MEESSQDELKPGSVSDLNGLMSASGYPYQDKLCILLNLMSDDVICNGGQGYEKYVNTLKSGKPAFTWSSELFQDMLVSGANTKYLDSWIVIYNKISGCNVVLDYLDKVTGGNDARENLRGQALAMRAYYYFYLVNLFGKPYNSADPTKLPGVPLKLTMQVTDSLYPRSSVSDVYEQVIKDLKTAANILEMYPTENSVYKMNTNAIYTLLSRVYLYEENWDSTIHYSSIVLSRKSELTNLNTFQGPGNGYYKYTGGTDNRIYNASVSPEILWMYQKGYTSSTSLADVAGEGVFFPSSLDPFYTSTNPPPYCVSNELMALYDVKPQSDTLKYLGDLRGRIFIGYTSTVFYSPFFSLGYTQFFGGQGGLGIRLSEAYLNRAEAYIHRYLSGSSPNDCQAALNDINKVRENRFDSRQPYEPINIQDGTTLLDFYKNERRREFPFEGHRWFDLRRYGMPEIKHTYTEDIGSTQEFVLGKGDNRYTLKIPKEVIDRNGALVQNP
ncbi:MAG: hypothetical protein DI598_19025 [Pseudopedobacter saltans]|uniref:RagB/SusD family nutrient uptake outer membrane protein n=1 Tax=Pseudopedobacter saltans TaxID=151895 RepID=A0A2W5EI40_9SPHI|nr:MAG: hypothetical protein DI598_19025 [Pseudopedobacter saltans]